MTQVWFYHLERRSLEQVLPGLLEKSLERGWKAVVQATSAGRVAALDKWLWEFRADSFLAHGTAQDGDGEMQPVFLTTGLDNPNGAVIRFCVEGADPAPVLAQPGYQRVMVMFDGNDEDALALARRQWADMKGLDHERAYWRQNGEGRWEKKG